MSSAGSRASRAEPFPGPALLFCPADRPERFSKAAAAADVVVLDLEDGVGANKDVARAALRECTLDPARTMVRINALGGSDLTDDLTALAATSLYKVMVPKAESQEDLRVLSDHGDYEVTALVETPRGILNARSIAASAQVSAVMWGAEDLTAAIGGTASRHPDGTYTDMARTARSLTLLAAAEHGKCAVDAVYLDIHDQDGLRYECEDAVRSGFAVKACIHPSQVAVVRSAYAPTPASLTWAERVLELAETSPGVFQFEGRMIDEPLLHQARTLLARRR